MSCTSIDGVRKKLDFLTQWVAKKKTEKESEKCLIYLMCSSYCNLNYVCIFKLNVNRYSINMFIFSFFVRPWYQARWFILNKTFETLCSIDKIILIDSHSPFFIFEIKQTALQNTHVKKEFYTERLLYLHVLW